MREQVERELVQPNEGRAKSLGTQGPTPPSNSEEVAAYDPQMSLNLAANTTPAFPIYMSATPQTPQMGPASWNMFGSQAYMNQPMPMGTSVFQGQQTLQQQQPMFIGTPDFQGQQAMQQQPALPHLLASQHLQIAQPYQEFPQPLAYEVQQTLPQDHVFQQQPALQHMPASQHFQVPQQVPEQDQSFQQPLAYEAQQTPLQDQALQEPSHPQEQQTTFLCPQPLPENEVPQIGPNYNTSNGVVPLSNDKQHHRYNGMHGAIMSWAGTPGDGSPDGGLDGLAQHNATGQNQQAANTPSKYQEIDTPVEEQEANTPVGEQKEVVSDQPSVTDDPVFQDLIGEYFNKQESLHGSELSNEPQGRGFILDGFMGGKYNNNFGL